MRLSDVAGMFSGITARLRRDAIAYAICAVCAVAVVIMAVQASVLALEPHVGAVYARLIVGGAFVVIALIAVTWTKLAQRPARQRAAPAMAAQPAGNQQFAQIAMIVEAVMLGYTLSRRSNRAK